MTLTLDVPPSTVAKRNALTEDERERQRAALIQSIEALDEKAAARLDDWKDDDFPDFEEARAAIEEGIADADAGRTIPFEQFMQEARARWKEKGVAAFRQEG